MTTAHNAFSTARFRVCPNCGGRLQGDQAVCPWCRTALTDRMMAMPPSPSPSAADQNAPEQTHHTGFFSHHDAPRFWRRLFVVVGLCLALLFVLSTSLAVYQGLQDRNRQLVGEALDLYEKGRTLYEEGRYDLAAAHFREALRIWPDFETARQALKLAEAQSAQQGEPAAPLPEVQEVDALLAEAVVAYEQGDYEKAATLLERILAARPDFRSEQITALAVDAHLKAGLALVEQDLFVEALRHFDQALALDPDNPELLRQRELANTYGTGLDALAKEDFLKAADAFRRVYLLDDSYRLVTQKLAEAHRRAGDVFFKNQEWCDAAEQYRQSYTVLPDVNVLDRAQQAESNCSERVNEIPVWDLPPTPTPTDTLPTPTPLPPGDFTFVATSVTTQYDQPCVGHYIRGVVRALDEAPLPGVSVLALDPWGNVYLGTSKANPPGMYDIPVPDVEATYQVYVVNDAGIPISPMVSVTFDSTMLGTGVACYAIDWQEWEQP
ncbi:hypothetical protein ARMA_1531 [Ardenticatena maritima]|uniref:Tetratricopeptide repeat protein n=2 Tax=Ardenticatena maritima TaxID=872965 RepID=A0A0N0RFP0_9CHLR|nr:tetratricopeptide repeat protein [Ardenticatena maritima]GAP63108.1 hypothetical protein ARMA_1531 [Ardenticatena maritima]